MEPRPHPAASLPEGLVAYKRTDLFSEKTIPAGLLRAHSTKEGVWGLIRVAAGELVYRILDERRVPAQLRLTAASEPGIVEPNILHEVEPIGPVLFRVEFFRSADR